MSQEERSLRGAVVEEEEERAVGDEVGVGGGF